MLAATSSLDNDPSSFSTILSFMEDNDGLISFKCLTHHCKLVLFAWGFFPCCFCLATAPVVSLFSNKFSLNDEKTSFINQRLVFSFAYCVVAFVDV